MQESSETRSTVDSCACLVSDREGRPCWSLLRVSWISLHFKFCLLSRRNLVVSRVRIRRTEILKIRRTGKSGSPWDDDKGWGRAFYGKFGVSCETSRSNVTHLPVTTYYARSAKRELLHCTLLCPVRSKERRRDICQLWYAQKLECWKEEFEPTASSLRKQATPNSTARSFVFHFVKKFVIKTWTLVRERN